MRSGHKLREWPVRIVARLLRAPVHYVQLHSYQVFGPRSRLHADASAVLQNTLFNTVSGRVVVGRDTFFGHRVMVLTGTHDTQARPQDRSGSIPAEGRDIVIGSGVWIGSGAVVIGPCEIGDGAIVAAGALVRKNVESMTIVAGVPAVQVRDLGRGTTSA